MFDFYAFLFLIFQDPASRLLHFSANFSRLLIIIKKDIALTSNRQPLLRVPSLILLDSDFFFLSFEVRSSDRVMGKFLTSALRRFSIGLYFLMGFSRLLFSFTAVGNSVQLMILHPGIYQF